MLTFKNKMIFMTSILHYEVIRIEVLGFFYNYVLIFNMTLTILNFSINFKALIYNFKFWSEKCIILHAVFDFSFSFIKYVNVDILFDERLTFRPRNALRPNFSVISDADIALGRSCLLANTNKMASLSSSSSSY